MLFVEVPLFESWSRVLIMLFIGFAFAVTFRPC